MRILRTRAGGLRFSSAILNQLGGGRKLTQIDICHLFSKRPVRFKRGDNVVSMNRFDVPIDIKGRERANLFPFWLDRIIRSDGPVGGEKLAPKPRFWLRNNFCIDRFAIEEHLDRDRFGLKPKDRRKIGNLCLPTRFRKLSSRVA